MTSPEQTEEPIATLANAQSLTQDRQDQCVQSLEEFSVQEPLCKLSGSREKIYLTVKRFFSIIFSILGLLLSLPVFIIVAAFIKIEDGGPVFYAQTRLGKDGAPFTMYKVRSMVIDAEAKKAELLQHNEHDGPAFKMTHDPRVTRVGRFIRKTSIDELPQLWNVLKGDMSLVGPRPPLPREVKAYDAYQLGRLAVKPGLTCYWQIGGRSELSFNDWVALDLRYIRERSLTTDLKILLKTVPAVLSRKGAF
ncbi:MAG: sugar transferase [Oscillospiraceae bacterium]|nr:sugar transferase [Oscillospiraceae bacterium]MDD4367620.1 sugar transferase [Oscillospiraceae bacterium]